MRRLGPYHPSVEGGLLAGEAALADGATAVIAHNDLMAIGALKRMKARGVSVPGDVSIVGFDDIFGADFCDPPLTTLSDRTEQAGRSAVDLLVALVREQARKENDAPADIVAPTQLVVRGSTGPAPTTPPPAPNEGPVR